MLIYLNQQKQSNKIIKANQSNQKIQTILHVAQFYCLLGHLFQFSDTIPFVAQYQLNQFRLHAIIFLLYHLHQSQQISMKAGSQSSSSFMDEHQASKSQNTTPKQPQQFKALFLKNLRLQSKQKGTNCCQILTPILCILFTFLMKTIAEQNIKIGAVYQPISYPVKFSNLSYFDRLNSNRYPLQWVMYHCQEVTCNQSMLGRNDGLGAKSGMLGNVEPTWSGVMPYHPFPTNLSQTYLKRVPFFADESIEPIRKSINNQIFSRLELLNTLNFSQIRRAGGFDFIPDGVYNISTLNSNDLSFDVKVKDVRELDILRANGISAISYNKTRKDNGNVQTTSEITPYAGILMVTHWLTQSFLQYTTGKTLESGIFFMPEDESGISFVDTLISFIAVLIFPVSLSLLFPVFLYTVVLEKEEKLIQMMKMNGMKISSYWLVYFIFNFILGLITNIIFVISGILLTGMRFFYETSPGLIAIVLIGWTLAQIGMAVFFQTFLNKSRSANIIGYLVSIWTSMIGSTLCIGVYQYPNQLPMGARFFAPFSFTRIIYLMLSGCSQGRCFGSISNIPTEMKHEISFLYLNFVFFFIVGAYLFEVIPQEFGVTRNPIFPITMLTKFVKRKVKKNEALSDNLPEEDHELNQFMGKNAEDVYSKKERSDIITTPNIIEQNPLVINNLRKIYYKAGMNKMYAACKSFNLKVGPRETFGLLGPNGAGKTTLISMITGMFQPNYGNAWIGGYDIKTSVEKAQLQMGVCPQFDLLWPQLTVAQHLYFYARLKGVPSSSMETKVSQAIQQVKLTNFRDFPSSSLSGGMKRRLSVAISLVGDPKIVFLDEPSTGLDPENRRQLWEVLAKCQKNRAIFITTHMMEQADALCNRVGIITKGVLRTVASQVALKKAYGGGYRVSISVTRDQRKLLDRNSIHKIEKGNQIGDYHPDHQQDDMRKSINSFIETQEKQKKFRNDSRVKKIFKFLQEHFPGSELHKEYNGYLIFKVPAKYKVSQIFESFQKMEKELQVADIAVTNSSLEDVFMNVVKKHEVRNPGEEEDGQKDGEVFMSFPASHVEGRPSAVQPGLNATPSNSQQITNPSASSIISKNRESFESKPKKHSEYSDNVGSAVEENANKNANRKQLKKADNDDPEDYF